MSIGAKGFWIRVLPVLLLLPVALRAGQEKGLHYEFTKNENSYSFRGRFPVKAEIACLLDVVFRFEHISRFASGAESVDLVEEGKDWNVVAYTYRRLMILENRSTWWRSLDRKDLKVEFEMLTSKNNLRILPRVVSSRGHYRIDEEEDGRRLEYFQECHLEGGILRGAYIERAEKEAKEFLEAFSNYVEGTCGRFAS